MKWDAPFEDGFCERRALCGFIGAAAALGGGALSAGGSLIGSGKASSAAKSSAEMQQQQANLTRQTLAPFVGAGANVLPAYQQAVLSGQFGPNGENFLNDAWALFPGQMTQAELEQTPGYQFTLAQGLKGVQSQASARGLGVSGAALKGAAQYATGLANQTYKDQFQIAQNRFSDALSLNNTQQNNLNAWTDRLNKAAGLGESAAAQTGQVTSSLYQGAGNALTNAGVLSGAGLTGAGNALNQGIGNYLGYNAYQQQTQQQNPVNMNNVQLPAGQDVPAGYGGYY